MWGIFNKRPPAPRSEAYPDMTWGQKAKGQTNYMPLGDYWETEPCVLADGYDISGHLRNNRHQTICFARNPRMDLDFKSH